MLEAPFTTRAGEGLLSSRVRIVGAVVAILISIACIVASVERSPTGGAANAVDAYHSELTSQVP